MRFPHPAVLWSTALVHWYQHSAFLRTVAVRKTVLTFRPPFLLRLLFLSALRLYEPLCCSLAPLPPVVGTFLSCLLLSCTSASAVVGTFLSEIARFAALRASLLLSCTFASGRCLRKRRPKQLIPERESAKIANNMDMVIVVVL